MHTLLVMVMLSLLMMVAPTQAAARGALYQDDIKTI